MKAAVPVMICVLALGGTAWGQVTDVTVCDVVNHPKKFDGKMVRIKGVVQSDFDELIVKGDSCDSSLWLSYPAGTKARSGPAAVVTMQLASNSAGTAAAARPAVTLDKNGDWLAFDTMLATRPKTPGMCLGCSKNDVQATLVGRIDGADETGLTRDAAGKATGLSGFGNLNAWPARMVLQSVSGATAQEIDYSKVPKVKDDSQGANDKDYAKLERAAAAAFPKGTDAEVAIDRALAAYGAPGVDNGVTIGFGGTAEVPDEGKSGKSSPDGVLFLVRFEPALRGDAMSRAAAHEGSEIASEREAPVPSYSVAEQKAWQAVLLVTIGEHAKSLTLPGGTMMWDDEWATADKTQKASDALNSYITGREEIPR